VGRAGGRGAGAGGPRRPGRLRGRQGFTASPAPRGPLTEPEARPARPPGRVAEPGETSFTRVAFAAALGAFLLIGAIDAAYGPLLRPVTQRFGVSLPVAGTLISINFAGALTGVLCALASFRRATRRPVPAFTLSVLCLGCLTVAAARPWPVLTVGVFLTGAGFGGTDFSLNHLMARTRSRGRAARLTVLNAAFGAGAVASPAAVNALGARILTVGFAVGAVCACAMAAGVLGISAAAPAGTGVAGAPGRAADGTRGPGADGTRGPGADAGRPAARRGRWRYAGVAMVALAYLLYVGCESGAAGWIPAHLEAVSYPPHFATAVTSGFWAAMTVGRLVVVPVSRAVAAHRIVLAACALLTLALALTTVRTVAPACYVLAGFAAAPIFPIGLDWIAAAFAGYRPATSWALTGSFAGGVAGPAVVAGVVSVAGVHAVPAVLTAFAAATFLAFLAVRREWPPVLARLASAA
jgi:MFS transporter, FHS family, glucose/mannose:H+ symporter